MFYRDLASTIKDTRQAISARLSQCSEAPVRWSRRKDNSRLELHVHKLKSHKDELNSTSVLVTFDLGNEDNLQKLAHTRGAEHTHPGSRGTGGIFSRRRE